VTSPAISFVIPTLNEAAALPALLRDLEQVRVSHEVIVADGGSADDTVRIATAAGATVVQGPRGRGRQLRDGAAVARSGVYCFIHADVRLDAAARAALERALPGIATHAFVFSLRIAARGLKYRIVERGTGLRSRLARLPYGDQGLIVSRGAYTSAGGFADVPLMEDVAFIRALERHIGIRLLGECIEVSARRWSVDGVVRRTIRNWLLLARYSFGASPDRLAGAYPAHSGDSAHHASQSSTVSMSTRSSSSDTPRPAA
jgi:rSAM/selenodomain-associated transferase 2